MRNRSRPAIAPRPKHLRCRVRSRPIVRRRRRLRGLRRPVKVEALALAKVGFQYISKIRFSNGAAMRRVLYRWRKEPDGKWLIVSVEDTTGKRSSWSDIPNLTAAIAEARAGNGNA